MMNNMFSDAKEKRHCKSTESESCQTVKMFFFLSSTSSSDVLVQNCMALSQLLSHKTASYITLSSAPTQCFFTTLESHEVVWTGLCSRLHLRFHFLYLVRMHINHLATKQLLLKFAELARNTVVRMKTGKAIVDSVFEQSLINDSSAKYYWRSLWGQTCCSMIDGKL